MAPPIALTLLPTCAAAAGCGTSLLVPIPRAPTAKPNASSRPPCANGLTPGPTITPSNAPTRFPPGSTPTTIIAFIAASAIALLSLAFPRTTCCNPTPSPPPPSRTGRATGLLERGKLQAREDWGAAAVGLGQQHLDVADVALAKAAFAVAKVELPHPDEFFRVAEPAHELDVLEHPQAPVLQGLRVVRREVFEMDQAQITRARERIAQRCHRRDEAAGKNVLLDEVDAPGRGLVLAVGDRDRLQQHHAVGLQQLAAFAEI